MHYPLARQVLGQRAAHRLHLLFGRGLKCEGARHLSALQLLEPQLQLLDLPIQLLGAAPELQALELRNDELQMLDLGAARTHQLFKLLNIIGKIIALGVHVSGLRGAKNGCDLMHMSL